MLLPVIKADEIDFKKWKNQMGDRYELEDYVSIGKVSNFIDFFNYFPFMFKEIVHKNQQSENMYAFMGQQKDTKIDLNKFKLS